MKMEPTASSETSAVRTQTPGDYPKRNKLRYTEIFSELVTPCLSVSHWVAITKHNSCLFLCLVGCLFVCLRQIYRVWRLIIVSVATYPVLRAVRPAIASVPILASIQGVPGSVDSHAYHARWELVLYKFFISKATLLCLNVLFIKL